MAPHKDGVLDEPHFATFSAHAWEILVTSTVAWKAFFDSNMTVALDPKKVLAQLPNCSAATQRSLATERLPLQQNTIPCSHTAVNCLLNTCRAELDPRQVFILKCNLLQANTAEQAMILVLEAENKVLQQQEDWNKQTAKNAIKKPKDGDQLWLSTEHMIS